MGLSNLFTDIHSSLEEERSDELVKTPDIRVERIISRGQCSPEGFWYDQDHSEWVLIIQGQAALAFAEQNEAIIMNPGDYLHIPAHTRHRVLWTAADMATIWLAIHYPPIA